MNDQMRKQHMERITDSGAVSMYDSLCAACEKREGGMTDQDQMIVGDIAQTEQIKQALLDDIAKRGIGKERPNGRQTYYQENKSIGQFRACAEQQRKLLAELRLTPSSRRAETISVDDDFDTFD